MFAAAPVLPPRRPLAAALLLAFAFHLLLALLMLLHLGREPTLPDERPIQVQLAPWPFERPTNAFTPPRHTAPLRVLSAPADHPASQPPVPAPPPQPRVAAAPAAQPMGPPSPTQQILRATLGCDHADVVRLTPQERARCEERLGAALRADRAAHPDQQALHVPAPGQFATHDEEREFLIHKPHNGCGVRVAGDQPGPLGGQKGVTSGVTCAMSF
jgi:hypothetical protein